MLGVTLRDAVQGVRRRGDDGVGVGVARRRHAVAIGQRHAAEVSRQMRGGRGQPLVAHVVVELDRALLDRAVGEDRDRDPGARPEPDDLHRADGRALGRRGDDDRRVVGEVGEQLTGVVEHLLECAVGPGEEVAHLHLLGRRQQSLRREGVDEEAVALVGGNAAGAGVRLGQIPVALEDGHLVADRRRADVEIGGAGDHGRADRLGRLDVALDHRPEDGGLPFVEHSSTSGPLRPIGTR